MIKNTGPPPKVAGAPYNAGAAILIALLIGFFFLVLK